MLKRLTPEQWHKFAINLLKFTAPVLAIFFAQLATGVDYRVAGMLALYALYALLSDYFSKMNKS
jgi:hypothetical protein